MYVIHRYPISAFSISVIVGLERGGQAAPVVLVGFSRDNWSWCGEVWTLVSTTDVRLKGSGSACYAVPCLAMPIPTSCTTMAVCTCVSADIPSRMHSRRLFDSPPILCSIPHPGDRRCFPSNARRRWIFSPFYFCWTKRYEKNGLGFVNHRRVREFRRVASSVGTGLLFCWVLYCVDVEIAIRKRSMWPYWNGGGWVTFTLLLTFCVSFRIYSRVFAITFRDVRRRREILALNANSVWRSNSDCTSFWESSFTAFLFSIAGCEVKVRGLCTDGGHMFSTWISFLSVRMIIGGSIKKHEHKQRKLWKA